MTAEIADLDPPVDDEASRCGTYGGAQRHRLRGETACEPCREAAREYMRSYRNRKGRGADRWWNRTRRFALERLAAEHPERFGELLAEVRSEVGPTPWDTGEPDPTDPRPA